MKRTVDLHKSICRDIIYHADDSQCYDFVMQFESARFYEILIFKRVG